MRSSSPRNALAFLGDKLQAKRDEEFLEEYRRQAHAALLKDPYSTSFSEEILQKNPRVKSVIKYKHQIPGDGSSFSSSSQVLYYSPVNPSAEHGRSSNSPRRRPSEFAQPQDGSSTSPRGSPSPRRSTLARTTTAADRAQSMSATLQMAAFVSSRSSQDRDSARETLTPRLPAAATTMHRSGDATVHWNADMENQQAWTQAGFATKKAVHARRPPVTSPGPSPDAHPLLSEMTQKRLSVSSSGSVSASMSESALETDSKSHASESDDSSPDSSSGSEYESDSEQRMQQHSIREHVIGDFEQLSDRCLRDRCLRPLHKLQHQSFLPGGKSVDPKAEPSGLVWQDSGFMTPFTPELLGLKRGQSRQISTAATGVTTVHGLSISGLTAVPALHFPPQAGSLLDSQRLASLSGHQSSSAHALYSSEAAAADAAAAQDPDESSAVPSGFAPCASRGSLVMQPLSDSILGELAKQQSTMQPAGLQHASSSTAMFGRGSKQHSRDGAGAEGLSATLRDKAGGKTRKKKSRRPADPAMAHVEDHLQILKRVYVKHASPRTMMTNRRRAEELGLAALPATLNGPLSATLGAASMGSYTQGQTSASAPASRPVTGQGSWYQTGLHVLPEELNAAVLEALAAEAAGIDKPIKPHGAVQRPATSPTASYKMRMEANMKAMVYDDALDAPNAGAKRIPAINPNRAYMKSLAQGSAKKHFQSVEVDLREAHRRLLATSKDLQPVTYAAAAKTHVYAC